MLKTIKKSVRGEGNDFFYLYKGKKELFAAGSVPITVLEWFWKSI